MPRIRLASAALLLALAAGVGAADQAAAAAPSSASVVTAQDGLPAAPATSGPDDMYWD